MGELDYKVISPQVKSNVLDSPARSCAEVNSYSLTSRRATWTASTKELSSRLSKSRRIKRVSFLYPTVSPRWRLQTEFTELKAAECMSRNNVESKREREKRTVALMIRLYCKKKHGTKKTLCPECEALTEYAMMRSDKCPFMETKTFCSNCRVHCYKPEMREKIREVMRFSGPRMIFSHPIMAVRHVIESKKEKKRLEKKNNEN